MYPLKFWGGFVLLSYFLWSNGFVLPESWLSSRSNVQTIVCDVSYMWAVWEGVGSTAAMMPALKLIDKKLGGPNQHNNVYCTFGKLGISIKKVQDAKGAFYVIISEENLEKILTEENRRECRREGYELQAPLEYNSMKTVVTKQLDYMIRLLY